MGLNQPSNSPTALELFPGAERVPLFGVPLLNLTRAEAIRQMLAWIAQPTGARSVYLVNAHTLNLACDDDAFRVVLTGADAVFGDGSGVRLAARLRGRALRDNLVGTDLVPELFAASGNRGLRCYLLGANAGTVARAAGWVEGSFPAVRVVGFRDGYVWQDNQEEILGRINASGADVLLVAMGNPVQEKWIAAHRSELRVAVCIGVGGLFDHWAGNLERAAPWIRRLGIEWLQILWQQPSKWRRYLLGNPRFVGRALRDAWRGDIR